jgi:tRNA(Ile)-lysidine synthase
MVRGTCLKVLEGISVLSGNKIRPLVNFTREDIEKAAKELDLKFREDSSNANDKYYRNKIRHHIIPVLKQINPAFEDTVQNNAEIIRQAGAFINFFIDKIKKEITVRTSRNELVLSRDLLLKQPEPEFVLYSVLSEFGFNASTVNDIFIGLSGISGKQFFSATHRLVTHHEQLTIQPIKQEYIPKFEVAEDLKGIETPHHHWTFEVLDNIGIPVGKSEVVLDYNKFKFPLTLRLWKNGDKIKPLGMQGHKKVSDVLIDNKISIPDKEKTWVLVSDDKIVWICGWVMNDDFKITSVTEKALKIRVSPI